MLFPKSKQKLEGVWQGAKSLCHSQIATPGVSHLETQGWQASLWGCMCSPLVNGLFEEIPRKCRWKRNISTTLCLEYSLNGFFPSCPPKGGVLRKWFLEQSCLIFMLCCMKGLFTEGRHGLGRGRNSNRQFSWNSGRKQWGSIPFEKDVLFLFQFILWDRILIWSQQKLASNVPSSCLPAKSWDSRCVWSQYVFLHLSCFQLFLVTPGSLCKACFLF